MAAFHYALITRRPRLSRGEQCAKASGLFYKERTDGYGPRRGGNINMTTTHGPMDLLRHGFLLNRRTVDSPGTLRQAYQRNIILM